MDTADIRRSQGYRWLVVVGLVSYGLVHLLLAGLALQVALGGGGDTSSQGALKEIAKQPFGVVLLWAMAVGLFALVLWQVLEATVGRDEPGREGSVKKRLSSAGRAVVYLALGISAIGVAVGSKSGSGQSQETLSAQLMSVPFGRVLVVVVGLGVLAVGISQIRRGVKKKFQEDLDSAVGDVPMKLGTVGYIAKGVSLGIIGGLFGWAALSYDPKKAGGMDAALSTVRDQPFGTVLLVIIALGIASFGFYCFVWAKNARY